jgi:hypothetical protein
MPGRIRHALVVSLVALAPAAAQAGPPLLCFPLSTGDAPSLPWGEGAGWNTPRPDYDRARLPADTIALLGPETPVLARMETLRRATIYASSDPATARELLDALRARARGPGVGSARPLALFDLGYAVEASRQTRHRGAAARGPAPTEDGYALVRKALARRGTDPAMEYAAALLTASRAFRGASDRHLQAAVKGAPEGSDLARTIDAHRPLWGARLPEARASR